MPLFNVPQRASKAQDKSIARKTKSSIKSTTTVRGGLLGRISEIKAMVEKNLGKYKEDYLIIQDEDILHGYIDTAIKHGGIAIDTETTGLDPMQDEIVGVCLYSPTQKAAYIPIGHISYVTGVKSDNQLSKEVVGKELKRLKDTKIIMFNAKFDIRVLRNQLGVYLTCYWDAYLAARILNENEPANGLKALHKKYCLDDKEDAFSFDALFKGVSFDKIPINVGYLYAAHDAIITYELYQFQKQYLRPDSDREDIRNMYSVFRNIEMACIDAVADMEDNGILFDIEYANQLSEKYNKLLEEKTQKFYSQCAEYEDKIQAYRLSHINNKLDNPINIASPTQISILLYDIIQVEPADIKNSRGTGEAILRKIGLPICDAILEYREVQKLLSTYIEKLPECVNPQDGRIHCSFNQYGADTGRFSSSDPNLQNIPSHNKDIRKMFIASNEESEITFDTDEFLEVDNFSEIQTDIGWVYISNLSIGDKLFINKDIFAISNIVKTDKTTKIYF